LQDEINSLLDGVDQATDDLAVAADYVSGAIEKLSEQA
jgi:hypothetical protein